MLAGMRECEKGYTSYHDDSVNLIVKRTKIHCCCFRHVAAKLTRTRTMNHRALAPPHPPHSIHCRKIIGLCKM